MSVPKQPVFVIGYPRSGTTYLLHFLLSSGAFPTYNFDETHFFSHYYRRYGSLSRPVNFDKFCRDIFSSDWFIKSGVDKDLLLAGGYDGYSGFFVKFMDALADQQGYTRWLEKTPWHILYIREIKASIPAARFLLIRRDPRDVVLSIYNYGWTNGIWRRGFFKGPVRAAIAWRWHMDKALRDTGELGGDVLSIRYEDLVMETAETAGRISRFLGVEIDLDKVKVASHGVLKKKNTSYKNSEVTDSPVFRWKTSDDHNTIRRIEYALGDTLSSFGYSESAFGRPPLLERIIISIARASYSFAKQMRQILFPLVRK